MSREDSSPADEKNGGAGQTPSMFASVLVFVVLIGLILLAVFLFGAEADSGPLQVSITMALLFSLSVAYRYGYRVALISEAITKSINSALGTIFILLAVGALIGSLYLSGTVPAFVYYGVDILTPTIFYIAAFLLASILSVVTGSSFTTIGALAVAFVGLADLMGVSPAIAGGAALSGAILGDKIAKISDTVTLTTAVVGGVTVDEHVRMVRRTAIPAWILSAILFVILGFVGSGSAGAVDAASVQDSVSQAYNISLLAFVPLIMVFVLSGLHLSGFVTLLYSAITGVIIAGFTQPELINSLAGDASLPYAFDVIKVGIETFATGFQLDSGMEQMDQLFSGGGTIGMLSTIWLILVAASFGAVADLTGMLQQVIAPVIRRVHKITSLIVSTVITSIGLNIFAADPYVSILLAARMFRDTYIEHKIKPVTLSTSIADSGTMFSYIVPWNVNGAFAIGAMGIGLAYVPYAFLAYLSPLVTLVLAFVYLNKKTLAADENAQQVYGTELDNAALPTQQLSA